MVNAGVVELVDTLALGASAARCGSSSLPSGKYGLLYLRVSYNGLLCQPSKLKIRVRFPLPAHYVKISSTLSGFLFRMI